MLNTMKIVGGLALIFGAIYAFSWVATNGKRQTARAFLTEIGTGDYAAARSRLNATLAAEWPEARFAEAFSDMAPFTRVGLGLIGRPPRERTMNLTGSAWTASGCVSTVFVSFDVWFEYWGGGEIEDFRIDPVCAE